MVSLRFASNWTTLEQHKATSPTRNYVMLHNGSEMDNSRRAKMWEEMINWFFWLELSAN